MSSHRQSVIDKCYKDANGKVVVAQFPNVPIITWFLCTVVARLVPSGGSDDLLRIVAFGSLFTWAWLELFNGVTYFRRLLGLLVLVLAVYSRT